MMTVHRTRVNSIQAMSTSPTAWCDLSESRAGETPLSGMDFIDYGITALRPELVAGYIPTGRRIDLSDIYHDLVSEDCSRASRSTSGFTRLLTRRPSRLRGLDRLSSVAIMGKAMILLDRDGVLNALLVDPEHGTIDSPLHPAQFSYCPVWSQALARLTEAGYGLSIVSNQPAWAKGKTSGKTSMPCTQRSSAQPRAAEGGSGSHLCLHRREDDCDCRKPKTGLLREVFTANPGYDPASLVDRRR